MKRCLWLVTVGFVLLMPFGMHVQAQPKEVTEVVTSTAYATSKVLPLEEGRVRLNYDAIAIILSDTGSGLFHGATYRVLGGFTVEKGKYDDERAWGVINLHEVGNKLVGSDEGLLPHARGC